MPLISRKGLCVHPSLKSVENLNEKCEDLTEKGNCPYNDEQLLPLLAANVIAKPLDIEDLSALAHQMQVCGYFASRDAAAEADIIVTPYQSILSEATRELIGISLYSKCWQWITLCR